MSEIDWSKAPEGAEAAYVHEYGVQFLKVSGADDHICYFAPNENWVPFFMRKDGEDRWKKAIPRPAKQEWEGGLPPVGAVVAADWSYLRYRVEWVGGGRQVLVSEIGWPDKLKITTPERLRPLKSQQERQREELIKIINDCDGMAYSFRPDDIADAILARYNLEKRDA